MNDATVIPAAPGDALVIETPEETRRIAVFAWRFDPAAGLEALTLDGWAEPFHAESLGDGERLIERGGRLFDERGERRSGVDAPSRSALDGLDVTVSVAAVVFALAGAAAVFA